MTQTKKIKSIQQVEVSSPSNSPPHRYDIQPREEVKGNEIKIEVKGSDKPQTIDSFRRGDTEDMPQETNSYQHCQTIEQKNNYGKMRRDPQKMKSSDGGTEEYI